MMESLKIFFKIFMIPNTRNNIKKKNYGMNID